jgi:Ca2+-binding RTX toxin-like protein
MAASFMQGYEPNVRFQVIATTGDTVDTKADSSPYRMVGIPDGLGAYDNGDGTITVVMNHELGAADGIVRDHGGKGAFVSKWTLNKSDLSIVNVEDAIKHLYTFNDNTGQFEENTAYNINRLCSADLAAQSAYYWVDPESGIAYGTQSKLFMTGEESGTEGKEFAVFLTGDDAGKAFEFADCGLFAWENNLSSPFAQKKTITIGQDDGQNGQVYVYVGEKQATGSDFQKAGLEDGHLFGIKVENLLANAGNETDGLAASGRFTMYDEGVVGALTGAQLDAQSEANQVSSFQRPEDGHWDTQNPNVYWFVTTASVTGQSRLYKLTFDDIANPENGGTIQSVLSSSDTVLNSSTGVRMMDNITVDGRGHVIIEEDVGNNAHIGRILDYDPVTDTVAVIAQHNPNQFVTGGTGFITQDEEASGIIDVTDLLGHTGGRVYLTSDQIHQNLRVADPELAESGQFLAMYVDDVVTAGSKSGDTLNGSAAAESFAGNKGNDIINAGSGNDSLNGGSGDDTLNAGAGDDLLDGEGGNDVLLGGTGNDKMKGGAGNDILNGGSGQDELNGGAGADTFVFTSVSDSKFGSLDSIIAFKGAEGDRIDLSALHVTAADLAISTISRASYLASIDVDHDGGYDMAFTVFSHTALSSADFIF